MGRYIIPSLHSALIFALKIHFSLCFPNHNLTPKNLDGQLQMHEGESESYLCSVKKKVQNNFSLLYIALNSSLQFQINLRVLQNSVLFSPFSLHGESRFSKIK